MFMALLSSVASILMRFRGKRQLRLNMALIGLTAFSKPAFPAHLDLLSRVSLFRAENIDIFFFNFQTIR